MRDRAKYAYAAFVIVAIGFLLLAFSPNITAAVAVCCVSALGLPMMDICLASMIHEGVDAKHYGKVYALWRYLAEIGIAVGVFFGGPIADALGTKATLVGFAVSVFIVVFGFGFWSARSRRSAADP
jgi:predicted MFS family arabinose efflux permease